MRKIRIGMIGAGAIAPMHCRGILSHPSGELVALADSSRERADALAREFRIPTVYRDYRKLIDDRSIEAVSVALPNFLHAPVTIAALEAGKHVLLEKPFATSEAEALSVIGAAERSGRILTVGMNQRFTVEAQTVRALVERGELGEVYHLKAHWTRRSGAPRFGTWFADRKRSGGGALLDIGVHMLDLALSLIGNFSPLAVSGFSYSKFGSRGLGEGSWGKSDPGERIFDVDDFAGALVRLQGGVTLELEASWARHQAAPDSRDVELFGTEGGATVFPPRLFKGLSGGRGYETIELQDGPLRYPGADRHHNWIDAILGVAGIECTLSQALAVQRIIDAVYRSAENGRETRLED